MSTIETKINNAEFSSERPPVRHMEISEHLSDVGYLGALALGSHMASYITPDNLIGNIVESGWNGVAAGLLAFAAFPAACAAKDIGKNILHKLKH